MTDEFHTVEKVCEGLFKDRGSKFMAFLLPVKNEDEIREALARIKKEHHTARHWCYAWRLGPEGKSFRANDDGEPSGTAGKPILNQLVAANLTDVLLVVVRYFGGTLLGTGGLINAYRTAAEDAIAHGKPVTKYVTKEFSIAFDTPQTNDVMRLLKSLDANIMAHQFEKQNEIIFGLRLSHEEKLRSFIAQNNIACRLQEK